MARPSTHTEAYYSRLRMLAGRAMRISFVALVFSLFVGNHPMLLLFLIPIGLVMFQMGKAWKNNG